MAELSWAGTRIGDTTSAARTRPSAARSATRSTPVTGVRNARMNSRAFGTDIELES